MKKAFKRIVLPLLLCCFALPLLVSCGDCKHKNTEWVEEVEATCAVAGTRVEKCLACEAELGRKEYEVDHQYQGGPACIFCGRARYGAEYLEYREITLEGEAGYEIIGKGNCTAIDLVIPALRNGKPILSVKAGAFSDHLTLTSVTFGKNIKKIGEKAFEGCVALERVIFPENSELTTLGGAAFEGCVVLTAFSVPTGVTSIPEQLFRGCTALKSVTLHDGVLLIGEGVFEGCEALTYATENGVKYLGTPNTPHLLLVELTDKSVTSFTVPADTKAIGTAAFLGCALLERVSIPEGVLSLSSYAFAACSSLAEIVLPSTLQSIGASAFAECTALTAITVPAATEHIGEKAFYKCRALGEISLPDGIRSVGAFAFLNTALVLSDYDNGKYLGNAEHPYLVLVDTASGMTSLSLHDETRVIADGALADSDAAELLTFFVKGNVVTLGLGAFAGCKSLEEVVFAEHDDWQIATSYGKNVIFVNVTDAAINARALVGTHKDFYWYR